MLQSLPVMPPSLPWWASKFGVQMQTFVKTFGSKDTYFHLSNTIKLIAIYYYSGIHTMLSIEFTELYSESIAKEWCSHRF